MSNPFNHKSSSLRERLNAHYWSVYIDKSESYEARDMAKYALQRQGVFPPLKTRIRIWWKRVTVTPVREGGKS